MRLNPLRLKAIVRKEFFHLIRDYRSLILAFALPLILIILLGYALNLDVDHVKTAIVDYDKSPLSRDFAGKLAASPSFDIVAWLDSSQQTASFIDREKASVAIVIPPGFGKKIRADREAQLQIIIDGSDPIFAGAVRGYLTSFTESYNAKLLMSFLNRHGQEGLKTPVEGRSRIWFNEDLESRNFIVPGTIAIIIIIVAAMLTSLVIAREYESGTMETIKSLPIRAGELILGKAIPYFLIGFADVLIAMLMGQILFGIVIKGNFWLLMMATSFYLVLALSLGLLISTLTKAQLVANQGAILITYLPNLLLSNYVFPIANMPTVVQWLTYLVPGKYYIDILVGVYLRDAGPTYLGLDLAVLCGMCMLLMAMNYILLKKEGL